MTMSDARGNEPITCTSCEYRYPRSAGVCPMCGKPAPAIEPLQALLAIPDEFSGADHEAGVSSSDTQRKPTKPGLRRLIPVIVVSIALMVFASFFHFRKDKLPKESSPTAELKDISAAQARRCCSTTHRQQFSQAPRRGKAGNRPGNRLSERG
jgi:hypothetical protein